MNVKIENKNKLENLEKEVLGLTCFIEEILEENKNLKEENEKLKEDINKLRVGKSLYFNRS